MHKNILHLIRLLNPYADAHAVDAGLDQDALVLVARDGERSEQHLGGGPRLDLGDIVALRSLGGKVGEGEGRC